MATRGGCQRESREDGGRKGGEVFTKMSLPRCSSLQFLRFAWAVFTYSMSSAQLVFSLNLFVNRLVPLHSSVRPRAEPGPRTKPAFEICRCSIEGYGKKVTTACLQLYCVKAYRTTWIILSLTPEEALHFPPKCHRCCRTRPGISIETGLCHTGTMAAIHSTYRRRALRVCHR